jgi:Ni,Fe-hydrogenase I cytochrome b subunit
MHVEREFKPPLGRNTFFVYEWAACAWRWVNALAIVFLPATGYYISNPWSRCSRFQLSSWRSPTSRSAAKLTVSALHDRLFWWVISSLGGSQEAYLRHDLRMWMLGYFTLVHVYVAIREDIMSRQAVLPTMITGHRTIRDCRA